ncbi:MAG TPA: MFS transporter [Anaerolineaceae bacterium]
MSIPHELSAIDNPKTSAVSPYAWVILTVALLAGIAAPLNQSKVPPLMPVLIDQFHLNLGSAGLLMSIFAITGFILALPAGVILQKLGPKITGLIAVGFLMVGSAIGALSTSAGLMFFSRLIEGAGMGLIAVVAPAVIASWFPPEKRGTPMGIWATWVPLGNLIMFNVAPALGTAYGWQAVWWAGAAFALVAFILYALLIRLPVGERSDETAGPAPDLRKALANRNIWLLALSFGCLNLVMVGAIGTYYPTFLSTQRGFSLAGAASIASLSLPVGIILSPIFGWLTDRAGKRKPFILISFAVMAVWMAFPFSISSAFIPALLLAMGVISAVIPTATFSAAPEVMNNPQLAGIGLAVIILWQNLGQLLGPMIFGPLVESIGWVAAGYWMIPGLLVAFVAIWLTRMR